MKKIYAILLAFISVTAYAQESTLKEVSVYGTKLQNSGKTISKVDSTKLTFVSQETPAILAQTVPSVFMQSDNGTPFGYSYFSLRGMSQNRLNYTLNGIPLNDGEDMSVYTTNYTNLFNILESIDVQRGAGINITGNSAFAGSLNFQTKNLSTPKYTKLDFMYGSWNSSSTSFTHNTGRSKKGFATLVSGAITHSDGFRDNSGGTSYNGFLSSDYIKNKLSLKFNNLFSFTRNQMAWLPTPEGLPVRTNILDPHEQDKFISNITQIQGEYRFSPNFKINFSPYFNYLKGGYNYTITPNIDYGTLNLEARNFGGYANLNYITNKDNLIFGLSYNNYDRTHRGAIEPNVKDYTYVNNGNKDEVSSYISYTRFFGKSELNLGVQYRHVNLDYISSTFSTELFNKNFVNANVSYTYKAGQFDLYALGALSHREPTRTDLLGVNDVIDSRDQINDVTPERVLNAEFGAKIHGGKLKGSINGFYMNFLSEIISTNQLNYLSIVLRKNAWGHSNRYGAEVDLTYSLTNRIDLTNISSFTKSRITLNGDFKTPVLTPKFIASQGVRYNLNKGSLGLTYSFMSESFLENTNDENFKLPSTHVLSFSGDYKLYKNVKLRLVLDNLTDVNYRQSGTATYNDAGQLSGRNFFYAAGFSVYGGVTLTL